MNLIGNNIKIIRKQIGLTQEELALHIGVTPQAVSRWENGTGMPDISMVVPLAKTLNVSTDYLFGLEKNEIDDNVYVVEGDARLEETFSELDIKMPEEDKYDTVGGFVVDMLGFVPENHTCPTVEYENCIFEALEVKDNWIEKVKITINNKAEE